MGGHEHREGHKSSRTGAWEGFQRLKQALDGLATAKGVSQSRIGAVAKLAAHYAKFYKHVVHDIEVFLWKAEVEHRLAGLYAIDAIIRQAHAKNGSKDAYVKRFLIRLSDTIAAVKKVPEESQPKVRHVIEEWQKRGVYTTKQIEDVGGREYLCSGQEEQSGNVTPRTSPGKLASLLSIIKQKKEEQVHSGDQQQPRSQDTYDRRQRDDAGAYNHRSYGERRNDDQRYDRRDVGGIMGDAPGVPVGSGRIRRAPDDREDERDPKKARGSRWGPPKLDNPPSNDRPSPIITSLDREGDYRSDSGRPGYRSPVSSRQAPLLQSPRGDQPRHEEWNRNAPSSRGSGAGWPREGVRSPQTGGRHNANPYEQGGSQRSPFAESDDRRSPGNRIPGTSGELCRNFLAGRCTFGDRCWHVHDPQAVSSGGSRPEMSEAKRKTVLCNNYPLGKCRFGDNCSFAHGEDELDKSARQPSRAPAHGDQNGGRWQPSPNSRPGLEQAPQSRISPSANAPAPPQARSYGAAQVYNEPHGDRGSRGGDSSVSYANAAAPSPGGRRLPPDHQPAATASTQGYPGAYDTTGSSYTNQGSSFSSTADQGRSRVPGETLVLPSPGSGGQSLGDRTAAAPTSAKVLEDEDDDGDTIEPEFTLQYDDDD